MAWEENSRICLHMQLIAILSRIGVTNILRDLKGKKGKTPRLTHLRVFIIFCPYRGHILSFTIGFQLQSELNFLCRGF